MPARGYQTNGLNQYTSAGAACFTCNANGNLVSDGTNNQVYDVENRLVSRPGAQGAADFGRKRVTDFVLSGINSTTISQ